MKEFLPKEAFDQLGQIERYKFLRWIDEPEQFGITERVKVIENK